MISKKCKGRSVTGNEGDQGSTSGTEISAGNMAGYLKLPTIQLPKFNGG